MEILQKDYNRGGAHTLLTHTLTRLPRSHRGRRSLRLTYLTLCGLLCSASSPPLSLHLYSIRMEMERLASTWPACANFFFTWLPNMASSCELALPTLAAHGGSPLTWGDDIPQLWGPRSRSRNPINIPLPSFEQQVAELEKEVQKQKELRAIYQRRLERTQEYLRYCLQMAQENGFLETITNNKDIIYQKKCPISFNIMRGNTSPQTPPPPPVLVHHHHHHHCDLVTLINQAKTNGWYAEPHELMVKEWLHGPGTRRKERVVPLQSFEERVAKAVEIAQAMQYLHEHKPKRTYVYMAPEEIRCEPYNEKCDVYSFGIIQMNLFVVNTHSLRQIVDLPSIPMEVAEGSLRPALPKGDDHQLKDLIDLIQLSWDEDPDIIPSFALITRNLKIIQGRLVDSLQLCKGECTTEYSTPPTTVAKAAMDSTCAERYGTSSSLSYN
ncbi:unnamed protein product [Camellia sinensis]